VPTNSLIFRAESSSAPLRCRSNEFNRRADALSPVGTTLVLYSPPSLLLLLLLLRLRFLLLLLPLRSLSHLPRFSLLRLLFPAFRRISASVARARARAV